jgi:hypothetical protein
MGKYVRIAISQVLCLSTSMFIARRSFGRSRSVLTQCPERVHIKMRSAVYEGLDLFKRGESQDILYTSAIVHVWGHSAPSVEVKQFLHIYLPNLNSWSSSLTIGDCKNPIPSRRTWSNHFHPVEVTIHPAEVIIHFYIQICTRVAPHILYVLNSTRDTPSCVPSSSPTKRTTLHWCKCSRAEQSKALESRIR